MTGWMAWFAVTCSLLALWILGALALDELRDRWNR